jgi:5-methylcytosine-specific restriction endonuclease McrA
LLNLVALAICQSMSHSKHQPPVEKVCKICKKRFSVLAYLTRNKPCDYCSTECALVARRKEKIVKQCGFCKKELILSPWQFKRITVGIFCSRKCYGKWRSGNLSRENSPNWKGGYTLNYGGSNWKSQRKKARERDGNTCRDCGITQQKHGYKLDVHHIVSYSQFSDLNEANSLDNLVTLCRLCHVKRHNVKENTDLPPTPADTPE